MQKSVLFNVDRSKNEHLWRQFAFGVTGSIPAICSVIGGLVAQEALKVPFFPPLIISLSVENFAPSSSTFALMPRNASQILQGRLLLHPKTRLQSIAAMTCNMLFLGRSLLMLSNSRGFFWWALAQSVVSY